MEPRNRRSYYVQRAPDIQKIGTGILPPTASLFSRCFVMKMDSVISDNYQEDLISSHPTEVVAFCNALRLLKETFSSTDEPSKEQVLCQLREVNGLLATSFKKCPSLYSSDILQMAVLMNSKIKGYFASMDLEIKTQLSNVIRCTVDQLSGAFNKSLSGISSFGAFHGIESFENLNLKQGCLAGFGDAGDEVDSILLNTISGIDKALQHATSWLYSAKFIMSYIEKRTALELDFAKHLMKLASQQNMRSEMLPLQQAYRAAFNLDVELVENIQKFCKIMQTEKFIQPLSVRCTEHKKICKDLKDLWLKEERQMQEATENLRKSKSAYNARSRELMKLKESMHKAIPDSNILNDTSALNRFDKRKRMEEEAVSRVTSAQEHYQKCISFANDTKAQMNAAKKKILGDIRQLVDESDRILKMATINYFTHMASRTVAIPQQFQALAKSSEGYEPGSVYAQYAEIISASSDVALQEEEPFVFQLYSPSLDDQDKQFSYIKRIQELPKKINLQQEVLSTELSQNLETKRLLTEENSGKGRFSVSRSLDSSPVQTRRYDGQCHRKLTNGSSFDGLTDLNDDKDCSVKAVCREFDDLRLRRGLAMSKMAQMHNFKRLRTFARCRQCDSNIYFNGFECSLCGLSCHKLCLRNLRWECGHAKNQGSFHQSDCSRPKLIAKKHLPDQVPYVVKKCIEQIDATGLELQGIYRVSAVKSRVEGLFQKLESEDCAVDLSTESPHTIAGLIRMYLRQLKEPLIPFQLCEELINLVKNSSHEENYLEIIKQRMKSVLSCLPDENFWTLSCLMHHLKRVAQFSEINLMPVSNLSVVFGPTLMCTSNDMVLTNSLADNKHQCNVVELLVNHAEEIFGPDPIPSCDNGSRDSTDSAAIEETLTEESPIKKSVKSSGGSNRRTYVGITNVSRSKIDDELLLTSSSSSGEIFVNDSLQHFAAESEGSCQSTTIWFDQNVYNEPWATENMSNESSQELDKLHFSDDSDDSSGHCVPYSDFTYPSGLTTSTQTPQAVADSAVSSEVAALASFHRMRAYSPQFHRRFDATAHGRQESFHGHRPHREDTFAVKSTKSASEDT